MCVDLSLGFLFCSIDLYVCLCANTILFWWLWLCSRAWSQEVDSSSSILLSQDCFGFLGSFMFPYELWNFLFQFCENHIESVDCIGSVVIFFFLFKYKFIYFAAKSLQSCLILCDPIDGSPSGSTVPGILQARTLEWVAISFSNAWKWKVKVKSLSSIRLLATPWTAAHQAPLSMGFSRQEYWSGSPLPSPAAAAKSPSSIQI